MSKEHPLTVVSIDGVNDPANEFIIFRPSLMGPDDTTPHAGDWLALSPQVARELALWLNREISRLGGGGTATR